MVNGDFIMKQKTSIATLGTLVGTQVTCIGFAHAVRLQSKVGFVNLRDISGIVQCVFFGADKLDVLKKVTLETYLEVKGTVVSAPQASGGIEIQVESCTILNQGLAELPIPVQLKGGEDTEAPTRFDYRWLDLRKPDKALIFKVWTAFEKGLRDYVYEHNFIQVYSPSFMSTPSETGAEVFEVQYFDKKAYLAQSPQFYKQMAMTSGFEKVFIAGPVFRAEASFTTRHLTEFPGYDFEIANIESHHDLMDTEEQMLISAFKEVARKFPELGVEVPVAPFPRIPMVKVKEILAQEGIASDEPHDLSPEEERGISAYVKREFKHDFVFVMDYHKSKSAFYHMRHENDPERSKRADLLYRGIEITTLAQREHRIEILEKQALEKGMNLELLKDYLNFFRYGAPAHGGAGLGPSRIIMKLLDLPNVREATYLPRDVGRLTP
jgi:aspartyl/asparaginyl-tRNA synthetase